MSHFLVCIKSCFDIHVHYIVNIQSNNLKGCQNGKQFFTNLYKRSSLT